MTIGTGRTFAGAAVAALVCVGTPAQAQAQRIFRIGAQDLSAALREFGLQSGQSIAFTDATVGGLRTAGITGRHEDTAALTAMLAGTGLSFQRVNGGFAIVAKPAPVARLIRTAAQAPAVAMAEPAAADGPADAGSGALEDIIVTAQKRSQNLQDVPISVLVASSEMLANSGANDIATLKMVAPGVEVQSNNGYALTTLRGVGSKATGPGIETPVAIYVDGVYYAAATSTLLSFNNISQVEVLKGPQGTLFGRNATGGLIQVTTRDPSQTLKGDVSLSLDNYATVRATGYVSGGIADNVAADIAITSTGQGKGYGTNQFDGRDVYKVNHDFGVRSKWLFTLGGDTEARLILDYSDAEHSLNTVRVPVGSTTPLPTYGPSYGGDPWDTNVDEMPIIRNEAMGASLKVDHDFGGVRATSITAYRRNDYFASFDYDYTPTRGRVLEAGQNDRQFSQELQLLSPSGGAVDWVIGAFYFNASGTYDPFHISLFGPARTGTTAESFVYSKQTTDSLAGFGQATWHVTDAFSLTGGLRYTSEKRELTARAFNIRTDGTTVITTPENSVSNRFKKLTWRLAADYQFGRDLMLYASYNRGFKSGGFNPASLTIPPFRPEVLDAYEAGFKSTLFDRRVRFNASAFYYDYADVQVQRAAATGTGIYNGPSAEIYGFDAELDARVTDAFRLKLGYQYTHGRYGDFPNAFVATPRPAGGLLVSTANARGNTTILTPESVLSAVADYTIPVGDGEIGANLSYYYNSGYYHEPDNFLRQDRYSTINANLRYETGDGMTLSVWGKNLTNEAVANFHGVQSLGTIGGQALGVDRINYAPPRTYGVTVAVSF